MVVEETSNYQYIILSIALILVAFYIIKSRYEEPPKLVLKDKVENAITLRKKTKKEEIKYAEPAEKKNTTKDIKPTATLEQLQEALLKQEEILAKQQEALAKQQEEFQAKIQQALQPNQTLQQK